MTAEDALLATIVLGSTAVAIGLMVLLAQARTLANVGIGGTYVLVGVSIPLAAYLVDSVGGGPELVARAQGLLEAAAVATAALYVRALAATSEAGRDVLRRVDAAVAVIWALTVLIAAIGLVVPDVRLNEFNASLFDTSDPDRGLWIFLPLWALVTVVFMYAYFLLSRNRLDAAERTRALCALIATPLLVASLFVGTRALLVTGTLSMVINLYGVYRYAVAQGERGAFLSRFLSPHVAEQVRQDGLTSVMQPGELELTVVACDLRGFTSYAEGVPSQAVIDLLGEYYKAVGIAVAEVDGTIKDYAGDGILVLVGAPLPRPDHAEAGLRLARRIHEVTGPVIERWSTGPHPLGIGVGAATGRVTVGAIGSDARMEYTAVGVSVNLAARLCAAAAAGETLVDARLAAVCGDDDVRARTPVALKGFSEEVAVFALAGAPS